MRSLAFIGVCAIACVACDPPRPHAGDVDTGFIAPDASMRADTDVDSSRARDAGSEDASVDPGACTFDMTSDVFQLDVDPRAHPGVVAMAAGPTSFGVVYSKDDAVGGENVFFVEVPSSTGAPADPVHVTMGAFVSTTPVIARTSAGWLVAWLSYRDGSMDVYALGTESDGHFPATPMRITHTETVDEATLAIASNGTTSALAWVESTTMTTVVQPIGLDGASAGAAVRLAPAGFAMRPTAFSVSTTGYVIGWGDTNGDALIQPLHADATAIGAPLALTGEHNTDGTIDAVISLGGGAVVYGAIPGATRHDVHAHLVDDDGQLVYSEQVLTFGANAGTDASITGLGGGYAVAYREATTPPMLRLVFVDSLLAPSGSAELAQVQASGATRIGTAADGNLLVTWADVIDMTTLVRALRVRCQ